MNLNGWIKIALIAGQTCNVDVLIVIDDTADWEQRFLDGHYEVLIRGAGGEWTRLDGLVREVDRIIQVEEDRINGSRLLFGGMPRGGVQ